MTSRHQTGLRLVKALLLVFPALCDAITTRQAPGNRGGSTTKPGGGQTKQPNIIFVLADDIGYRDLGFKCVDIYTPNIDELATSGVLLDNYYVQQSCSPTRSQLLTGRYQIHTGLQHGTFKVPQIDGLPLQFPTMADILRRSGYSTNVIGKWHLGYSTKEYTPLYRGFDTFYGILPPHSDHFTYETCDENFVEVVDFCGYALVDQDKAAWEANGTYSTHAYTDRAVKIVQDSAQGDKPFYLYLAYTAPHFPTQSPESYYEEYVNIVNPLRRVYAGMITALDEGIGRIVQALKDEGLWENTIFIFSSDNGGKAAQGGSNWPLRGDKETFWEGGVKATSFVHSPLLNKNRAGEKAEGLMHVSDWFPTLAEAAGANIDDITGLDGVSQWPMISKGAEGKRTEILHTIEPTFQRLGSRLYNDTFDNTVQAAIRVGDWKLITGEPGDGNWYQLPDEDGYIGAPRNTVMDWHPGDTKNIYLFNIAEDPSEIRDLSDKMPEKVRELLDRLAEYEAGAAPVLEAVIDPNANPNIKNGGVWLPWIES